MPSPAITDITADQLAACLYLYRLREPKAVDGDTIDAIWDFGDSLQRITRFRLYGVNTPESVRPTEDGERERGLAAKAWLTAALDAHADGAGWLMARTFRDKAGKFGRMLVELVSVATGDVVSLNRELILRGHAVPYLPGSQRDAPAWLLEELAAWRDAQAAGVHRFDWMDERRQP